MDENKNWNGYPLASIIYRQWCRPITVKSILDQNFLEDNLKTSCRVIGGIYEKNNKFYLMNVERVNGEEKLEVRVLVQSLPIIPVLLTPQCVEVFGNICRIVSDEIGAMEFSDNINESVLNKAFIEGQRSQFAIDAKMVRPVTPNMAMHFNKQYKLLKDLIVYPPP